MAIAGGCRPGFVVDRTCRPQLFGDQQRRDLHVGPPGLLVAMPVQMLVMWTAERHRKPVTYLAAQGSGLREPEVMGIRRPWLQTRQGWARMKSR